MASSEDIEVTGLTELADAMDQLPPRVARSAIKPALSAAGQVFVEALHETVPKDTGALDESISYKVHTTSNLEDASVLAGPRYMGGYKHTSEDPGVRGKFLEFGTRKMAPRFWMRRAFEMSKNAAYDASVAVLKQVLDALPK